MDNEDKFEKLLIQQENVELINAWCELKAEIDSSLHLASLAIDKLEKANEQLKKQIAESCSH